MEGIASQEMRVSEVIKTEVKTEVEGEFYTCMVSENYEDQISEENSESSSKSVNDIFLPLRCRLCAFPNNDMVDIFSSNAWEEDISEMIKRCLPIVVRETDTLPKQACRFCLEKLELCFQFQRTVTEAEKLLLASDSQSGVKHEETGKNHHTVSLCNEPCGTMGHDNIKRPSKPFPAIGIVENESEPIASEKQITDTNIEHNLVLRCLKPCSVTLLPTKSIKNNLDEDGRMTTAASRPPEMTSSRSRTKKEKISSKELEIRGNPTVPEEAHTSQMQSRCNAGVEAVTNQDSRDKLNELHSRERIDSFEYCEKMFTGMQMKNLHCADAEGPFECYVCKKHFETSPKLKRHKAIHLKNGDYRCFTCDVSFKDEFRLKRHDSLVHTHEKPWQCDYCKEHYNLKANLKRHLSYCKQRPDTKGQIYKCNLCGKAFKTREGVSKHNKFHTGEGLHSCQYCGKKFISVTNRNAHHRMHTNERPFKCPICEKTFAWTSSLRNHAAVHSGKK